MCSRGSQYHAQDCSQDCPASRIAVSQACGRVSKQKHPPALPNRAASRGGALLSLFALEEQQVVKEGELFSHLNLKTKQNYRTLTKDGVVQPVVLHSLTLG